MTQTVQPISCYVLMACSLCRVLSAAWAQKDYRFGIRERSVISRAPAGPKPNWTWIRDTSWRAQSEIEASSQNWYSLTTIGHTGQLSSKTLWQLFLTPLPSAVFINVFSCQSIAVRNVDGKKSKLRVIQCSKIFEFPRHWFCCLIFLQCKLRCHIVAICQEA